MKLAGFLLFLIFISSLASADSIHLTTGSFDPLLTVPLIPQNLRGEIPLTGKGYYIVQFKSFPQPSMIQQLSSLAKFYGYYPENSYLIQTLPSAISAIQSDPSVRWVGIYHPFYKLSPDIGKRPLSSDRRIGGMYYLVVELFPDADVPAAVSAVEKLGGNSIKIFPNSSNTRLKVRFPSSFLADLARIPGVQWVEEEGERKFRNDTTSWVIQSDVSNSRPVWEHDIHGEGQIIGHIDGLIGNSSCYFPGPISSGKIVAIHNQFGSISLNSHGVHTAGTAAGNKLSETSADSGDGNAFAAKLAHTNLCDVDPSECDKGGPGITLEEALIDDHDDGARIHTNSWGDDGTTAYTADCHDIDRFSRDNEEDLVVFAVTNTSSLKTPENAKNVLAVGASKQAPDEESHSSGGAGPTADGRRKPEIYAPGRNIVSANTSSCGTTTSSGTSMAAPAITAAGALTRQYYQEGWYPGGAKNPSDGFNPSGALIKATLLNGTVDMTAVSGYPSNLEGWGRLLLDDSLYFAGDSRMLIAKDVRNADGFSTGSTATDTYNFTIATGGMPLKVTLVWTDPESPVGNLGNLINNLNLSVTTPNGTFKGNVFSNGQSVTGGTFDVKNNVEQVLIMAPSTGDLVINVAAAGVGSGPQGYALVVSGGVAECLVPPGAPGNFIVTQGPNENSLSWNAVGGASYNVYRNTIGCGSSFQLVGSTNSTNLIDEPLSAGFTYFYKVRSIVAGCQSAPSSCESGTPFGTTFLFFDDFGDGRANDWTITGNGTATVNGSNQFELTGTKKITVKPTAFAGCDDCDLSFDIAIDSGKPIVFFPFKDKNNYRQFIFITGKNKVVMKERINGLLTKKVSLSFTIIPGQIYQVKIENTGGTVNVTIGGQVFSLPPLNNFSSTSFQIQSKSGTSRVDNILVQ